MPPKSAVGALCQRSADGAATYPRARARRRTRGVIANVVIRAAVKDQINSKVQRPYSVVVEGRALPVPELTRRSRVSRPLGRPPLPRKAILPACPEGSRARNAARNTDVRALPFAR